MRITGNNGTFFKFFLYPDKEQKFKHFINFLLFVLFYKSGKQVIGLQRIGTLSHHIRATTLTAYPTSKV